MRWHADGRYLRRVLKNATRNAFNNSFAGIFKNGKLASSVENSNSSLADSSSSVSAPDFKIISTRGASYEGSVDSNGRPCGKGTLLYPQGDRYHGDFVDGGRNGRGMYTFPCGDVYDGEWKRDVREGRGVQLYANGDVYDGEWCDDIRSGEGSLVFSDGTSFVGQWIDDSYGLGTFTEATRNRAAEQ